MNPFATCGAVSGRWWFRIFVLAALASLTVGCIGSDVRRPFWPDYEEMAIFGAHVWWHEDDHVTTRWYVVNLGNTTWGPVMRESVIVADARVMATAEPESPYWSFALTYNQYWTRPVPPGGVVAFEGRGHSQVSPSIVHHLQVSAFSEAGHVDYINNCVQKEPVYDLAACHDHEEGFQKLVAWEEPLHYVSLLNRTGWLPPPVDVPEGVCTWGAAAIECDLTAWNWVNVTSTVSAIAEAIAPGGPEANASLGTAEFLTAARFDPLEIRPLHVTIPLQPRSEWLDGSEERPPGVHVRVWRHDLPTSVYERVIPIASP